MKEGSKEVRKEVKEVKEVKEGSEGRKKVKEGMHEIRKE